MYFYDNKEEHGKIIDWKMIFKEYRKLLRGAKVSDPIYDPTTAPVYEAKFFQLLSERSSGKTTGWLLIGMLLNKHYGTITQYVRQNEDMIKPSIVGDIFRVIMNFKDGYYIEELTGGKYNTIYYHWKKAYYARYDYATGKITEKAPNPFLQFLSVDQNFDLKSGYNAPDGDLILFDEFIGKTYNLDEYINFMDLCSTIIRKRKTPIIVMLANTINVNSMYFKEFEVSKEVKKLKKGEHTIVTTEKGTRVYIEIIELKQSTIKQEINRLFFGFNNPRLASITGGDITWSFDPVPHIHNTDTDVIINRLFRIDTGDTLLQLDITKTEDRGIIINCHECTSVHEDSIIFTLKYITATNQIYGVGRNSYCKFIWGLYEQNKWYYDCNQTGSLVKNYLKQYRQSKYY